MIKKSKSRSKVTTSANTIDSSERGPTSEVLQDKPTAEAVSTSAATTPTSPPLSVVKNGKIAQTSPSGFNSASGSKPQFPNISTSSTGPSLAGIPGIVDDFLAPKFVKVLNLRDHGYEKIPPPSLSEYKAKVKAKATDSNANKVDKDKDKNSSAKDSSSTTSQKKNKRKKSKPVKNSNANTCYDSEDGRELDVLNRSYNGNGSQYESSLPTTPHPSGLTSKDVSNLAQLQRIRNSASAFRYEGNNIVLVSNSDNEGEQYPGASSYDDYNYDYDGDGDDDLIASGGGAGCISVPSDETSTLGLDHDDDDDEEARVGSWSLSHHHVDYSYSSKQQASSSVASSESENTGSSASTTASGSHPSVVGSGRSFPPLAACTNIWDGVNNTCEIKDCSKPATKKCSQCKGAFYCCEEHQRSDWKRHKNECIPYRMESLGDDVSVAVAARNIPQGMIIFKEKPLLVLPLAEPENDFLNVMDLPCIQKITNKLASKKAQRRGFFKGKEFFCEAVKPACFGCLKSVEFIGPPRNHCGTCKLPLCSYKCYLDPFHQAAECQVVLNQGGWKEGQHRCYHSLYMDIEILRALQLECRDTAAWEKFLQLKQNLRVEAYKNSESYRRFIEYYKELVPISAKMSGYHDDLIGNVHSIITALSFRPSLQSPYLYKLIFGTQILFGHDCVPNTFHYLEEGPTGKVNGMSLVTRAAVPIIKKEIITIDFSPNPYLYYPLRRMILRNVLSIDNCQCKRCRTPGQLGDSTCHIKCPRCRGIISPENASSWKNSVWGCNSCLEEFSYRMIAKITEECREEMSTILSRPKQFIVPALRQFISKREDQDLDPGHSIMIQAWSLIETHLKSSLSATRLAGPAPRYPESTIEEYRLLGRCCDVIEQHLDIVRPGICYDRASMYLNRYYVNLALSAKRFGLRLTNRNEYIHELMQCTKSLQDALKIFTLYEGYRDVHLRVNEVMGALCTTKSFLTEQIRTNLEESSSRNAAAVAAAASSTAALFRDN